MKAAQEGIDLEFGLQKAIITLLYYALQSMLDRLLMPRTHALEKFAWALMGNLASTIYTTTVQGSEFDGIQQL